MAVVLAVIATGCGTSPTGIATAMSGQWRQSEQSQWSSFRMNLTSAGSSITGTGTWSGEAAPGGAAVITGSVSGPTINLDIMLTVNMSTGPVPWFEEHFTGRLVFNELEGTMTAGPPSQADTSSAIFTRL